jgi:uncharacterized repeat protein (TIGR02543 family)
MRKILKLGKYLYLKKVGIFFIAVVLIAGVVGCEGEGEVKYDLAMAVSPTDGGTATDETNTSPYTEGTDVSIKAVAAAGYQFDSWTAPAGAFDDEDAEETTFTMPAQDVTVTANFVAVYAGALDHAKCYFADGVEPIDEVVYLEDQFGAVNATVESAWGFCNPVMKWHDDVLTAISNPDHHLTIYEIGYEGEPQTWFVEVDNQFGTQNLTVSGPFGLAVPTQKVVPGQHEPPVGLDHYLVYEVIEGPSVDVGVSLQDQFHDEPEEAMVYEPILFANPVRKTHGDEVAEIVNPETHAVVYRISCEGFGGEVQVVNQFGEQAFDVYTFFGNAALAVPSEKLDWEPVVPFELDHFKLYNAEEVEGLPVGADVYLEDQFGAIEATVGAVLGFCNPAEKVHYDITTPILNPDHHFTAYNISYEGEPQEWFVEVENQFGENQQLVVSGPLALLVPTQKEGHDAPVGLDHYLMYQVIDGPYIEEIVGLDDQFLEEPEFYVGQPMFFANPVRKTHGTEVTEILRPDDHLVIYFGGAPGEFFESEVQVTNQFGEQTLHVIQDEIAALCVPSEKLDYWETEFVPQPDDPLAFAAVLGDYSLQLTYLLRANDFWTDQRDWDVIDDDYYGIENYDVVVVNMPDDPGETTFQAFLDAADANGVGVVFTSSYDVSSDPWGISLLEWNLSDPAGQGDNWGTGDVYYKVTQDHPIFDGWSVDDEIIIITGGDCDHAWFSSYSGTTIADVGSDYVGIEGDAVAVSTYGASTHVLLASLGPQYYTDENDWTDDGRTIFINAVCFAAGI